LAPMFDPYRDWLDIPAAEQPPTYYRLLGIAAAEANPEAIKEAALRQTTRVRMYQTGPQAELCTRVLNEIAKARAVLLNPKMRQKYDARLAEPPAPPAAAASPPPASGNDVATAGHPATWPRPEPWLGALGYGFLLLCAFSSTFCLTFQSARSARVQSDHVNPEPLQVPSVPPPTEDPEP